MSISTVETKVSYLGNGTTDQEYPIPYKYLEVGHVKVYANGNDITPACNFLGDGTTNGGSFTTQFAFTPDATIEVCLEVPFDQPVSLQETGTLPAKTIEVSGFDRLNMQIRRVWQRAVEAVRKGDNVSELTNDAGYLTGIPDNSINSSKIVDGTVGVVDFKAGVVDSLNLADSALQSGDNVSELANDAGYLTGIPDNSVGTAQIVQGSIDSGKIKNSSIFLDDLGAGIKTSLASADSSVQSVTAGANVTIDNTDPANPVVSSTATGGGSGGTVQGTDATYDIQPTNEGAVAGNARGENSVDLQTLRANADEVASGTTSSIIGGIDNRASGGNSTVLGGQDNIASAYATLAAGRNASAGDFGARVFGDGTSTGIFSLQPHEFAVQASALRLVDGNQGSGKILTCDANGSGNWADAPAGGSGGTVQGTDSNTRNIRAADEGTVAGNARGNNSVDLQLDRQVSDQVASGVYSAIIGGRRNKATGSNSAIVGGIGNSTTANDSFVSGNINSNASPRGAVIGGISNDITGTGSNAVIVGGTQNEIASSASHSGVFAGNNNTVTMGNSASLGGQRNTLGGTNSVALGATDGTTSATDTLIAGGDATASHEGARVFGDTTTTPIASIATNEFAIQGSALRLVDGNQGNGKVLTCDANGSGNWVDLPAGNNIGGTVQGTNATYDVKMVASDDVAGANARGEYSVDLQGFRTLSTQVTSGQGSAIVGGYDSTASGLNSGIVAGAVNTASGDKSFVGGGKDNVASSTGGVVLGGEANSATTGVNASVVGGDNNTSSAHGTCVIGGTSNSATAQYAGVLAGANNAAQGNNSFVMGGYSNTASGARGVVMVGADSTASGDDSLAVGTTTTASHKGAKMFGYGKFSPTPFASKADQEFGIQADNFRLAVGTPAVGDVLTCNHVDGSSSWAAGNGTVQGTDAVYDIKAVASNDTVTPNARGENSVDLQTERSAATQVASGEESAILGGRRGTASGVASAVIAGFNNIASGINAICLGGRDGVADGNNSLTAGNEAKTGGFHGARVFGDSSGTAITAIQADEFAIQGSCLRLIDGNQGVGKVLTADGSGRGNWAAPAKVVYTVATLPATPAQGDVAMVTDATANTFHSVVAGTGSNVVPVFFDGTSWRIG